MPVVVAIGWGVLSELLTARLAMLVSAFAVGALSTYVWRSYVSSGDEEPKTPGDSKVMFYWHHRG